jgi:hypothetical protein
MIDGDIQRWHLAEMLSRISSAFNTSKLKRRTGEIPQPWPQVAGSKEDEKPPGFEYKRNQSRL